MFKLLSNNSIYRGYPVCLVQEREREAEESVCLLFRKSILFQAPW